MAMGSGVTLVDAPGWTGRQAYRCNPVTTGTGLVNVQAVSNTMTVTTNYDKADTWNQMYIRIATAPSAAEIILRVVGSLVGQKCDLLLNADRTLSLANTSGSIIGTGSTVLATDTWYRVGLRAGTGASAAYEVITASQWSTSPTVEFSGTGDLHTSNAARIDIGKAANRNGSGYDIYILSPSVDDAAYRGPVDFALFNPTANGDSTAADKGAGTGELWELVNQWPPNTASYLLNQAALNSAYLAKSGLLSSATPTGAVKSVKAMGHAVRNGGASCTLAMRIRHGGQNSDTGDGGVNTIASNFSFLRETDPSTSAAWARSAQPQWGFVQRDPSSDIARLYDLALSVEYVGEAPVSPSAARRLLTRRQRLLRELIT
jgi:hypothetical protein